MWRRQTHWKCTFHYETFLIKFVNVLNETQKTGLNKSLEYKLNHFNDQLLHKCLVFNAKRNGVVAICSKEETRPQLFQVLRHVSDSNPRYTKRWHHLLTCQPHKTHVKTRVRKNYGKANCLSYPPLYYGAHALTVRILKFCTALKKKTFVAPELNVLDLWFWSSNSVLTRRRGCKGRNNGVLA